MAYCGKCLHLDVCKTAETCDGHVPRCKHFMDKTAIKALGKLPASSELATRADQIRAMSDLRLAIAIYNSADCVWCRNLAECGATMNADQVIPKDKCIGCVLTWLRQPMHGTDE